jgi:hypothetical protein
MCVGDVCANENKVLGAGSNKCSDWTKAHASGLYDTPLAIWQDQWIVGYVSSVNRWADANHDVAGEFTNESLLRLVGEYCSKYPDYSIEIAAAELIAALKRYPVIAHSQNEQNK